MEPREEIHDSSARADGPGDGAPPEELEALREKAAKADEYLERWQRVTAELQNLQKRVGREKELVRRLAIRDVVRALLPSIDNLHRALTLAVETEPQTLIEGVRIVHDEIHRALADLGVELIEPKRMPLDPNVHEAVFRRPEPGVDANIVLDVHERGYVLGDIVIRPARVTVALPPAEGEDSGQPGAD